ncbi:hypothetical protein [Streptomyces sp. TR02-1]|uniref:hypothetical protein n=1 Tax=Streptomyces sp. TR02-1 TaxID=3385977 RepID=UPI0039A31663
MGYFNLAHTGSLRAPFSLGAAVILAINLTGCTASEDEMLKDANCQGKVLTSREDGRKVLELLPDDIDKIESGYYERNLSLYEGYCSVSDAEHRGLPEFVIDAAFLTEGANPSKLSPRELVEPFDVDGRLLRIGSKGAYLGGVSGGGDAVLRVPCTTSRSTGLPPERRHGAMAVAARTEDAPDADSLEQRQNAADLALSFLRHAVKNCEDDPKVPKTVDIRE